MTVGSLDIGHGLGGDTASVAVGDGALDASVSGQINCTAIGKDALGASGNAAADNNTAVGFEALDAISYGAKNTGVGSSALSAAAENDNTAVGYNALNVFTGSRCGHRWFISYSSRQRCFRC